MVIAKDEILKRLKDDLIPKLKSIGFKGSYPQLYRVEASRADYLAFSFAKSRNNYKLFLDLGRFDREIFGNSLTISTIKARFWQRNDSEAISH